jgi:hypothetical protein
MPYVIYPTPSFLKPAQKKTLKQTLFFLSREEVEGGYLRFLLHPTLIPIPMPMPVEVQIYVQLKQTAYFCSLLSHSPIF